MQEEDSKTNKKNEGIDSVADIAQKLIEICKLKSFMKGNPKVSRIVMWLTELL